MELQFPSFPFLFFILFMYILLKLSQRSKRNSSTSKLPPGPWKLPIIGNIHQLVGSLPHHALRDLAKTHGPLMSLQLGEVSALVVSSPEMAKEVMKTHDIIFSSRPEILASRILFYNSTDIAFSPYDDHWRQLRKICILELLTRKRVKSYRPIREQEVSNLIKSISSGAGMIINLTEKIYSTTNSITSIAAFGKKCKYQELFLSVVGEVLHEGSGFSVGDIFPSIKILHWVSGVKPKLEKLRKSIDQILESIVNEHKAGIIKRTGNGEAEEVLVDVLLRVREDQDGNLEIPLTDNSIKAVILDMFVAGTETSSITVDWAMAEMLKNPRVMKKAQAEVRKVFDGKGTVDETDIHKLEYLKLVIKEVLRLHPPGPLLLPRECGERCQINGYEIPVKTKVIVNAWAMGRDPKYWNEPERFYPERFLNSSTDYKGTNFEYIPFGAGRRMCPGMFFGLANIELPLAQLLYHFDWELPNGMKNEDLDMTEKFGASARRRDDLCLILVTYHKSSLAS